MPAPRTAIGLPRDILSSTSRGSFPPYFNLIFLRFVRVLRGAVSRLFSAKARAPNCSVCFGFLRELRGAGFVYYILVRRVLEFNDLAFMDFCLLANISNFFGS